MKLEKFNPFVVARYNAGYKSQDALANAIGVNRASYGNWETGRFATLYSGNLTGFKKMCDIFGWSYEEGMNNLSNLNKWRRDPNINIVKPTMAQAKSIAKSWRPELATLDTSNTDISKEEAMLNNPLKIWRAQNNLTRSEAAKKCNVDINVYSDCEDGVKKPAGYDLTKIMNTSGVSLTQMASIFNVDKEIRDAVDASMPILADIIENKLTEDNKDYGTVSVPLTDDIDHNQVIENALNKDWPDKIFEAMGIEKSDDGVKILNEARYLTEREERVLKFYYIENRTLRDIGLTLGVTSSRVSEIKNKALRKIKRTITKKLAEAKPEEPKKPSPLQEKLDNQTVSYLKIDEQPVNPSKVIEPEEVRRNSKNISISKQTARVILHKLYGVVDSAEYLRILSEFTKGGLNL